MGKRIIAGMKEAVANLETRGLIATLEERGAHIRDLERQIADKGREIGAISEKLGDEAARAEKLREWLINAQEENKRLQAVIAALDAGAIQRVKDDCNKMIQAKNIELIEVKAELQRCLGWIDAHTGKHPTMGLATDKPERALVGIDPAAPGSDKMGLIHDWMHRR